MVKNCFFNYHCKQIVSQFLFLDVFPHHNFAASTGMGIFGDNKQRLASIRCCDKEPFLEELGRPVSASGSVRV